MQRKAVLLLGQNKLKIQKKKLLNGVFMETTKTKGGFFTPDSDKMPMVH